MGYNARSDEIRGDMRKWAAHRDALATMRLFNARLSAKKSAWFWPTLQNNRACVSMRSMIAILAVAAVPVCAQAQSPSVPRVSKDDAQKVVAIISGDDAKTQTYCDIQKLGEQIERAYEKRDIKLADELLQKIETLEKTLGSEYVELTDRLGDIDPENDKLATEIMSVLGALDRLCTR